MNKSANKIIAFTVSALMTSSLALKAENPAWTPLFNGTNLNGWVNINGAQDTWSVKNRSIHCTGKPICALRTVEQYENFILELEWRHLKPGGNAGVFIWSGAEPAIGQPFLRAIEVQVLDHAYGKSNWFTTHGDVFPIHGSSMKPFPPSSGSRSFPSEEHSKGTPEWNHYRIHCNDGILKLSVNGHEVSGGEECNWRKGFIALESEGSPVEFRNIRIKKLKSNPDTSSSQAAPLAGDFFNLYNGKNFSGWPKAASKFLVSRDWTIVSTGLKNENDKLPILWSDARVTDNFEAFFDIKIPKNSNLDSQKIVSICINNNAEPILSIGKGRGLVNLSTNDIPMDKWIRIFLKVENNEITITNNLNFKKTFKSPHTEGVSENPNSPCFGFIPPSLKGVEFANFFIKPLVK